jgi:hypothetical protein
METIIGFAAGFLVGTREGRAGLARLRKSLRAIADSPQTRRLAADAITIGGSIARQASAKGASGTGSAVVNLLFGRSEGERRP